MIPVYCIGNGRIEPELANVVRYGRKAARPVVTASGDDADLARLNVHGETVAVPFHLEGPVIGLRGLLRQQGEASLDTLGHWIKLKATLAPVVTRRETTGLETVSATGPDRNNRRAHNAATPNSTGVANPGQLEPFLRNKRRSATVEPSVA